MSVLINMEMPTNCKRCRLKMNCDECEGWQCFCLPLRMEIGYFDDLLEGKRRDDCPLIPIPPHGDLIDRAALEKEAQKRLLICGKNDDQFQKPFEIMRAIALAPTIIEAENGGEA